MLVYLSRDQKRTLKREATAYALPLADYVRIRLGVQKLPPLTGIEVAGPPRAPVPTPFDGGPPTHPPAGGPRRASRR